MSEYYIGLSGLAAAQRAFDVIGNNMANAATEGYHRQRLDLSPAFSIQPGEGNFIGGVNIEGVTRIVDTLLEQEIFRQQSILGAVTQETETLNAIQAEFGEFASDESGLNIILDSFFTALKNLSAYPTEEIWQNQAVSEAEKLSGQFRMMGKSLNDIQNQITIQSEAVVQTINSLSSQIAALNGQIERILMVGGEANSIIDRRDQFISDLSELVDFEMISVDNGVLNISITGIPLVTGSTSNEIEVESLDGQTLGVSIKDAASFTSNIQGGTLGGFFSLHNDIVSEIIDRFDSLANAIIQEVNHYHVMGTGSAGSFEQLIGEPLTTNQLLEMDNIQDGTFYIRLTNTSTDEITRQAITVDADTDTLSDVATAISGITGLTASVSVSNELIIAADANYEFDFMPSVLPEPTLTNFNDPSPPTVSVSGIYEGTENDTFEFTVVGDGAVSNGTLTLQVTNSDGDVITSLNIGSGYAAGDLLDVGNGIYVSLTSGNVAQADGDSFEVDVFANTDTAGFLSAVGLNTFFTGSSASDMGVNTDILQDPKRVATAIGSDGNDNLNISRIADIKDTSISSLGELNCNEFYRRLTFDIGQDIAIKEIQKDNLEVMVLDLQDRRTQISGVDINEQAAQLLVFEQMFQAMAEYMNTLNRSMNSLMEII